MIVSSDIYRFRVGVVTFKAGTKREKNQSEFGGC